MRMLAPAAGDRALDLYAGVGLFSAFLAEAVGPTGYVTVIESDGKAVELAKQNLAGRPQVSVVRDRVDRAMHRLSKSGDREPVDLVVLDPPRAGAKRQVVRAIVDLAPRAVAYVACDPASLARDLAYFAEFGYRLADLRAFDLFPMTHHVECVALVVPESGGVTEIDELLDLLGQLEEVEVIPYSRYSKLLVSGRSFGYLWEPTRTVGLKQTLAEQEALVGERPTSSRCSSLPAVRLGRRLPRRHLTGGARPAHLRGLASVRPRRLVNQRGDQLPV